MGVAEPAGLGVAEPPPWPKGWPNHPIGGGSATPVIFFFFFSSSSFYFIL
jgi:hypothetical protein